MGIVITGAGVVAIGFGIPINDLILGYTLIVAGTTALAGGLILVGLAAAVAELTKIAEAVRPRAAGPATRAGDGKLKPEAPAPEVSVGPRVAEPRPVEVRPLEPRPTEPRTVEPRTAEPRVAKPRPAAADTTLEVSASAIERLQSSLPRNERPKNDVVATAEEVPLSPNGSNGAHHPAEPAPAAKATNGAAQPDATVETMKGPRLDFLFRSKSTRPGQAESFDALWPKRPAKGGEVAKQPSGERPTASEKPPSGEAPPPPPPVEAPPGPRADEPRPVGILKSGVVDGMAYTLYADGSIEAQLPQGTVRFGSIAELRAHIENNP
jgi:hypothetical protein